MAAASNTNAPTPGADKTKPDTANAKQRRDRRSLAIAFGLGGLAILFFVVTLVRLGANVATRSY